MHSSVASSPSNGGISSSSTPGQSTPPLCSPIKSGRELWDEWDWATSANIASESDAVVGGARIVHVDIYFGILCDSLLLVKITSRM